MKKAEKTGISMALIACMILSAFPIGTFAAGYTTTNAAVNAPPLIVTEVVQNADNESTTGQDAYDAIEIYNTTDHDINLNDYAIAQKSDYVSPFAMTSVFDPNLYSPTYTGINHFTSTSSYTDGEVADPNALTVHSHDTKAVWVRLTPSSGNNITSPSCPYYSLNKSNFAAKYGITDTSKICYAEYPKKLSGSNTMTASLVQNSSSYTAGSNFFLENLAYVGQESPAGIPGTDAANTPSRGILYIVKNTATASSDKNGILTNNSDIVSTAYYMRATSTDNNKSIDLFFDPMLGVSYSPANSNTQHASAQTPTMGTGLKNWQIPGVGSGLSSMYDDVSFSNYITGNTTEMYFSCTAHDDNGLISLHIMYRKIGETTYKSLSNNCCMLNSSPTSDSVSGTIPLNSPYCPFNGTGVEFYFVGEDSIGNIFYWGDESYATPDDPNTCEIGFAQDKTAAQNVVNTITALTGTDKVAVKSARSAYEALTPAQKLLVTNYNTLVSYESQLYNYGLLISEILPDPSLANNNDNTEFLEVHVTGSDPVPLSDLQLKIQNAGGSYTDNYFITEGEGPTSLQPYQTYVFGVYLTDSFNKSGLKYTSESDKENFWTSFAGNTVDFGSNLTLDKAHRIIALQCNDYGFGIDGASNLPNSPATTVSLYSKGKAATVASSTYNGESTSSPDIAAGKSALFKQVANSVTAALYQKKAAATPGTILSGQTLQSSDANLTSITVPFGTISPAFAANTTTYTCTLPYGSLYAPAVSATASSSLATIAYTQATSSTGTAQIVVTAENGATKTYTINFRDSYDKAANYYAPPLIVTEVVQNADNESTTGQDAYDAIEIYNTSDHDINLSDYAIAQKSDYVSQFNMTSAFDPNFYSPTYTGINRFTATSSYTSGEAADAEALIIHPHDTKAVWVRWTPSSGTNITSPSCPYYSLNKSNFAAKYGITDTSRICYAEYPKNLSGSGTMTASLTQNSASYTAGSNFFLNNLAYVGQESPAGTPGTDAANTARRGILYIVKNTATASSDKNGVLTNDSDIVSTAYYMRATGTDNNKSIDLFFDPILGVSYVPANSNSQHAAAQTPTMGLPVSSGLKTWQMPGMGGDNTDGYQYVPYGNMVTGNTPELAISSSSGASSGFVTAHLMYRKAGETAYKPMKTECCMLSSTPITYVTVNGTFPINTPCCPFSGTDIQFYFVYEDALGNILYDGDDYTISPDRPCDLIDYIGTMADEPIAQNVVNMITALTGTDKAAVKNARSAYESLSTAQKLLVTNYNTLVSYESNLYDYGLLISEILPDPSLANSNDNTEFLEVYVTGDDPVPLSDLSLKIQNAGGSYTDNYFVTEGNGPTSLQPHQTYVFGIYLTDSCNKSSLKYYYESDKANFWTAFANNTADFGSGLSLDAAHRIIALQCDQNGMGIDGASNIPNGPTTTVSLYSKGKAATVASSTYNGESTSSPDISAGKSVLFKQVANSVTAVLYQKNATATPGTILPGQLL
ncbi:MAG: hypothetical protein Q8865_04180 [Bacillota bacterium]|nr:hypothetical protein [Bacillota bacterium]